MFISKLKLSVLDPIIQKAIRALEKGTTLTHVLAEILLYTYFKDKGYYYVSIEETIGLTKCDVYIKHGSMDMCTEIETHILPTEHSLEGYNYIIARHVKKLIQIAKEEISLASFAYPFGLIPLIPLMFLKPPENRTHEEIERIIPVTKKFYNLDYDDIKYLEKCAINSIYIYDIASLSVRHLSKEHALQLISLYLKTLNYDELLP